MTFSGLSLPRLVHGLTLAGALVAALTLAACGRKGPLDLPPAPSSVAPQSTVQAPGQDPDEPPPTQGPNRRLLIDGLLN